MEKVKDKRINREEKTPGIAASNAYGINSDLYKAVIENALEGFIILDIEGNILDANEAFSRMNGYSRKELLSMKVYDLAPTKTTPEDYTRLIKGHIGMGGASFETQHSCKDGRIIDVMVSSKYLDTGGGIFFSFHRDITEQKKKQTREQANHKHTREELKESEDRYRTLIELGNKIGEAVIMLQDTDGREGMHVYVSDQWPSITGYLREELLDMSFFDLISPEDKQAAVERHQQKMSGKAIPDLVELSIIHKNGEKVPIEITSAVTSYQGMQTNVVYIRDITDRTKIKKELTKYQEQLEDMLQEKTKELNQRLKKQKLTENALRKSENRYRTLFQSVPVAILEMDFSIANTYIKKLKKQGIQEFNRYFDENPNMLKYCISLVKCTDANKEFLKLFKIQNEREFHNFFGKGLENKPQYHEVIKNNLINIANGMTRLQYEEHIPTYEGDWQYHLVGFIPAPGYEETLSRTFLSIFDITEIKRLEHKLQKSYKNENILRKKLEDEIEQRSNFTRAVVHELKTPLTPLIGASEVLSIELQDEPYKSYAKSILNGAQHLSNRVDELIDIAKGEIGILRLDCQELDPLPLICEIVKYMEPEITRRNQTLHSDFPASLRPIFADGERMKQILLNLLTNASKFTSRGGHISLTANENNNYLRVNISDNGIGIDNKAQKLLFKPYQQSGTSRLGGLGLGLSLCKMLVDLHGGSIKIKGKRDKGTEVSVLLPCYNKSKG